MAPPASRAYGNPFHSANNGLGAGGRAGGGGLAHSGWNAGFNGVHQNAMTHSVSRPAFQGGAGGLARTSGTMGGGVGAGTGLGRAGGLGAGGPAGFGGAHAAAAHGGRRGWRAVRAWAG